MHWKAVTMCLTYKGVATTVDVKEIAIGTDRFVAHWCTFVQPEEGGSGATNMDEQGGGKERYYMHIGSTIQDKEEGKGRRNVHFICMAIRWGEGSLFDGFQDLGRVVFKQVADPAAMTTYWSLHWSTKYRPICLPDARGGSSVILDTALKLDGLRVISGCAICITTGSTCSTGVVLLQA
ncbi:unnamed protein product [Somion occarium]|uniref:Uncharacterized protein n=1 Tax=Somion occarium TaxID=3059160 RepID=A0ABP1E4W2_9APHY